MIHWMYDYHDDTWLLLDGKEIIFGIGGVSVRAFEGTDLQLRLHITTLVGSLVPALPDEARHARAD
jgi:hypothetical protein